MISNIIPLGTISIIILKGMMSLSFFKNNFIIIQKNDLIIISKE